MKKRLMSVASLLLVLPLGIAPISASETESGEKKIIEEKIDETVNQALNDANVTELSELTNQQEIDLVAKVNEIKSNHSSYYTKDVKVTPRASSPYYGDVLATLDEKTFGIPHGHAGIGYYDANTVIEANPGDGVKKYSNRITGYWRNCSSGGIYGVSGASSGNYSTATNYAYDRIGRGYGFDPIAGDFYCSELVYYAWGAAGYDIDYNRAWGTPILPSHLMLDGDTYLKESF